MSFANNLSALARLLTAAASGVINGVTPPAKDSSTALATTEWFKAEQATETNQGTAKVATQVQTNAGTDDATIVTPRKLRAGFSISLGQYGYIAFPFWMGGLILQWGSLTGSTGWAWTFPIAFPTGVLASFATSGDTGATYVTLYNTTATYLQGNRWNIAGNGASGFVNLFVIGR
jgi:hypothetical protein